MQALLRHASITATMDICGQSVSDGNRQANGNAGEMVLRAQQTRFEEERRGDGTEKALMGVFLVFVAKV